MADRAEAARRGWQHRNLSWVSADVQRERDELDRIRRQSTDALLQARFGHDLMRIAEWCVSTCLIGGSSVHTAYLVAGVFLEGLNNEWALAVRQPVEGSET